MNAKRLLDIIVDILKQDKRLWDEDKTELNQTLLFDLLGRYDESLIQLLLESDLIRNRFFIKINDVFVFKNNDFKFFMEENKINNSYTKYLNRIGLHDGLKFINNRNEVVINFPFKDCVLEGGQSTEEGIDYYYEYDEKINKTEEKLGYKSNTYNLKATKRNEIFYNQIIARDEIDRLEQEKAFVNWKRYTKEGIREVNNLTIDETGLIRDNLIIKGNNLLALHSLKSQFAGKVKLIYLDPPYNTEEDDFKYNDRFTRSTWLTFMKNRLEVAEEFLRDDGYIALQISDKNVHYIKILMDEIFGEENFINNIVVKMSEASGVKMAHVRKRVPKIKEHILLYKRKNSQLNPVKTDRLEWDDEYRILLQNFSKADKAIIDEAARKSEEGNEISEQDIHQIDSILEKVTLKNVYTEMKELNIPTDEQAGWLRKNAYRICRSAASSSVKQLADDKKKRNDNLLFCVISSRDKIPYIVKSDYTPSATSPRVQLLFAEDMLKTYIGDIWTDINTTGLENEGTVQLKNGKKPEKLLKRIIDMTTLKNDIVMDCFLGSGTTAAVAHKMNRQYIGIEQLDYGEDDPIVRLEHVIQGDDSGISDSVDWRGGGEFISLELAKWNEKAIEEINSCKNLQELKDLFAVLCDKYFLHYNVQVNNFKEEILQEENFAKLTLEEQKSMFVTMLDLNQLYVLKSEMEDTRFGITEKDQELTRLFYDREGI